jgi:hypothetical protein
MTSKILLNLKLSEAMTRLDSRTTVESVNVADFANDRDDENPDHEFNAMLSIRPIDDIKSAVARTTGESENSLLPGKLLNGKKTPVLARSSV